MPSKKSARPPPKLRTKTGCNTCRTRRKKCDERRPICSTCQRLNLLCSYREVSVSVSEESRGSPSTPSVVWSDAGSDIDSVIEVSRPSSFTSSIWCGPRGLRTQRGFNIFQYCVERYMNVLVFPEAGMEFRNLPFIFAASTEDSFVMHAALAPAALHASAAGLIPREDAMVYTQSALQGLRLATRDLAGTKLRREAFLAGSLFMGIFEVSYPGLGTRAPVMLTPTEDFYPSESSSSLTHYRATAKVLEESFAGIPRLQLSQMSAFERTLLDSVLYHFATRLLLAEDIEPTCASFPTGVIAKYIEALDSESDTDTAPAPVLPVIGKIPPALFLNIYQITWLSRQLPLNEHDHSLALQCLAELTSLQTTKPMLSHDDETGFDKLSNSELAAKLYAVATRIFIWKVIDPDNICSTSSWIEALLATGYALLNQYDGTVPYGQFICWPIFILGCAACPVTSSEMLQDGHRGSGRAVRAQTRQVIRELLRQIWKSTYSGHVQRVALGLEKIWQLPGVLSRNDGRFYNVDTGREILYDGLLALISKGGPGTGLG